MDKQTLPYWQSVIDPIYYDVLKMIHPGKDIEQGIKEAYGHLMADETRLMTTEPSDFKRLVNGWLTNKRFPKFSPTKNSRVDLTRL